MNVSMLPLNQNQKRYFQISLERRKETRPALEKGRYLLRTEGLNKALEHSYHQIAKDIGRYGTKHPHTATAFHQAALLHADYGEPDVGLNLFNISHDIHKQNGGIDNPHNSTSYGAIATTFFELGKFEEALENGLNALKLYQDNHNHNIAHPASIRKRWELAQVYLELGCKKQKEHDFAEARNLYAQGLKHALDAEQGIYLCPHGGDRDKKYSKLIIDSIKTQARTLPAPPEWLPSGTIKDMTEPFRDNKLPFTQPEPPLKAKL